MGLDRRAEAEICLAGSLAGMQDGGKGVVGERGAGWGHIPETFSHLQRYPHSTPVPRRGTHYSLDL